MANMGFNVVLLNVFTLVCNFCIFTAYANTAQPEVLAIRLEKTDAKSTYSEDGIVTLEAERDNRLQFIGIGISEGTILKLTTEKMKSGTDCDERNGTIPVMETAELQLKTKGILLLKQKDIVYYSSKNIYYVCLKVNNTFVHQGGGNEVSLKLEAPPPLPIWVNFIFLAFLLCLSGLFSGLNLGLMALDQTELQIVLNTGSDKEKKDAGSILPVRKLGNFLLCSLLLGNVLVNVIIPLLLDNIPGANGPIAVLGSTFGIVVFGEIVPQAVCSRHGLAVGAKTIWLTKFFMLLTSPLSFPISKILDCLLGEEVGTSYNRERLLELLRVTQDETDLNKDEVNILQGALVLQTKTVVEVMTPLSDSFLLPLKTILDFDAISDIKTQGYSRIPVYDGDRTNIVHILLAKDLLFIDPDDKKPLEEICNFYNKSFVWAEKEKPLNQMLNEFKTGEKGHLAIVKDDGEEKRAIGIVTLEDIIEEIIQAEIIDEDDVVTDNRSKQKRIKKARYTKEREVKMFMDPGDKKVEIAPQISLAVFQFLSSSVEEFSPENMRTEVLKKLLTLDVFRTARGDPSRRPGSANKDGVDEDEYIVKRGVGYDFFLLIIEGKVDVQIGTEGHVFESGPFTCFGKSALAKMTDFSSVPKSKTWIPDCNIRPVGEVLYFKLRSATYWAAYWASKRGSAEPEEMQKHIQIMIEEQTLPPIENKTENLNNVA